MNNSQEIVFPLDWEFRIVAISEAVDTAQAQVLGILHRIDENATVSRGLESRGGKYVTLRAINISDALAAADGVKMLI